MFGHKDKKDFFEKIVREDTLHHAYIFFGDEGIGKCLFAEGLAHFLESGVFEVSPQVLIDARIFRAPKEGSLGIEDALEIRSFLWESPLKSKRRVAIVDGVQTLTFEAQSALLKVVEEAPRLALILFIGTNLESLLPPLQSRIQKIHFGRFKDEEVAEVLRSSYNIGDKEARDISKLSFGRIGRALSLLQITDKSSKEKTLISEINEEQAVLKRKGSEKYFKQLKVLVEAETSLKRYNLNENLQKKALEHKLKTLAVQGNN